MEITHAAAPTAAPAPAGPGAAASGPALASDFDTFLRMLTAQVRNQDPLNPLDTNDFAVQLATFSSVEQQVRTNDLLQAISRGLDAPGMAELARWVGLEVRSPAPVALGEGGAPVTLHPAVAAEAEEARIVIRDQAGRAVAALPVPAGGGPVTWDGRGEDGAVLAPGLYAAETESRAGGAVIATAPAEHFAAVTEARAGGDGATALVLAGGAEIPAAAVAAVRAPER